MFNNTNVLFFLMMTISSIMSISSTNWFGMWMGLELNMISFVPLMINNKNILSSESALKYFLIQAIASASFLSMCLVNSFYLFSFSNLIMPSIINFMMMIPLMLKLGVSPFQSWFVMVMQGLTWHKCLILMTWQKMAPMFILFTISNMYIITPFALLSLVIGAIGGLNQTSLKKIMSYSSINHMGWMLSAMYHKYTLVIYFFTYLFMNSFIVLNIFNKTSLTQIFMSTSTLHFSVAILSLSGLPPFLGFIPKWMIIQMTVSNQMYFLCMLLIMMALITIYFYTRMLYSNLLINNSAQKWSINMVKTINMPFINNILLVVSTLMLFMFNFLLN